MSVQPILGCAFRRMLKIISCRLPNNELQTEIGHYNLCPNKDAKYWLYSRICCDHLGTCSVSAILFECLFLKAILFSIACINVEIFHKPQVA